MPLLKLWSHAPLILATGGKFTTSSPFSLRFAQGAIRMTRTPGRDKINTITLEEILERENVKAIWASSNTFSPVDHCGGFFDHLPKDGNGKVSVPVMISRTLEYDPLVEEATKAARLGLDGVKYLARYEHRRSVQELVRLYQEKLGPNFVPIYPWLSGSGLHSKIIIALYENFLRVAVTSANLSLLNLRNADNHWFIQDFPKVHFATGSTDTAGIGEHHFAASLFHHAVQIGAPPEFITPLYKQYDFSKCLVTLVTSIPSSAWDCAENHNKIEYGRNRLGQLSKEVLENHPGLETELEVCTSSLGDIKSNWLKDFYDDISPQPLRPRGKLPFYFVYPSKSRVDTCEGDALKSAWGVVKDFAILDIRNYECGIFVPGDKIGGLVETGSWEDVVPYCRPVKSYGPDDEPWSCGHAPRDTYLMAEEKDEEEMGGWDPALYN